MFRVQRKLKGVVLRTHLKVQRRKPAQVPGLKRNTHLKDQRTAQVPGPKPKTHLKVQRRTAVQVPGPKQVTVSAKCEVTGDQLEFEKCTIEPQLSEVRETHTIS